VSEAREIRVLAPAKLNLSLEILGKRDDGHHELSTHLVALGLHDEVRLRAVRRHDGDVRPSRVSFRLDSVDPCVPRDERNLAVRALALTVERAHALGADRALAFELELVKRLPSGAGLGGGSADAAAAAFGAAILFGIDPDDAGLLAALGALGADVPFFLTARETGFAEALGKGERIRPEPLPEELWFVLLTPELSVSTAEVYSRVNPPFRARPRFDLQAFRGAGLEERRAALRNDLEGPALRTEPRLGDWFELLREAPGAPWRLCGSGASFFALFASRAEAERAVNEVRSRRLVQELSSEFELALGAAGHGVRVMED